MSDMVNHPPHYTAHPSGLQIKGNWKLVLKADPNGALFLCAEADNGAVIDLQVVGAFFLQTERQVYLLNEEWELHEEARRG